ncbi:MAG: sugar phosphate isomerase/epimerase [Clostridia bacterium]|nr:sugar phosphate isomerase/epimerase [Clostridia bacterium]
MRLCAFADEASNQLAGQIEALKRNDISLLEIRGVDGENIKDISPAKINKIASELSKNGIGVWSIGSPCGKSDPTDSFDKQLDTFKRVCESAQALGATRIRMFSFYSQSEKDAFKGLEAFCRATPSGIVLCHENEKGIFGDTYQNCVKIHKEFPDIKAVFDPANFVQCDVDTKEAWDALSPYIDYMHVKDALKDKRVVRAGYGIGNVEYLINEYAKMGGEVLTLEPHLMEFHGLSELENGESVSQIPTYKTNDEAFDAGAQALKDILARGGLWK